MSNSQAYIPKNKRWVSRETWKYIRYGVYGLIISFVVYISVAGWSEDDSVQEEASAFNGVLKHMYDIKSPQDIMFRYFKFMNGDSITNYTMTVEKQPRNRYMVVTVRNPEDGLVAEEKYRMLVEDEKNHWKVVMVERNWRCNEGKGNTDWGAELCK